MSHDTADTVVNWICFGLVFWAVCEYFGPLVAFGAVCAIRLLMPYKRA